MSNLAIDELRSHLRAHLQTLQSGATAIEIVAAFRAKHPQSVIRASRSLEDIGLVKLLNEVGTRLPSRAEEQPDLFAGYSVPSSIYVSSESKGGVHTPIAKATIGEVEAWIEVHGKPRLSKPSRVVEMQRLIEDIKPYAAGDHTTVGEAISAAKGEQERVAS